MAALLCDTCHGLLLKEHHEVSFCDEHQFHLGCVAPGCAACPLCQPGPTPPPLFHSGHPVRRAKRSWMRREHIRRLTRQPLAGRHHTGGFKIGDMAHGEEEKHDDHVNMGRGNIEDMTVPPYFWEGEEA